MNIYLYLLVSQGPALVWNYPKERFIFDRMKRKARPIHFCWEGWKSWGVSEWRLNLSTCLFFREATFHGATLCSSWFTQESLSHFHVCVCVCSNVCVRECRHERHRRNLHGNDVPVSQAPARIRGRVGGRGSTTQAKKRKNIRCWCTEKNQTPEEHSALFAFSTRLRCSFQSEIIVTRATNVDSEKISFVS